MSQFTVIRNAAPDFLGYRGCESYHFVRVRPMAKHLALNFARLAAVLLFALPCSCQVPECIPGKLSDYEKLGPQGCSVGDVIVSQFTRTNPRRGLPSRSIAVTPGTSIDSTDPGILIEGPWTAGADTEWSVSYNITVQPKAQPIVSTKLQMQYGTASGTGQATVEAVFCPPGTQADCGGNGLKLQLSIGTDQEKKVDAAGDLPTSAREVHVTESVKISGGRTGSARVNGFMTVFELQGIRSGGK
jgi:hypothetical protein